MIKQIRSIATYIFFGSTLIAVVAFILSNDLLTTLACILWPASIVALIVTRILAKQQIKVAKRSNVQQVLEEEEQRRKE